MLKNKMLKRSWKANFSTGVYINNWIRNTLESLRQHLRVWNHGKKLSKQ